MVVVRCFVELVVVGAAAVVNLLSEVNLSFAEEERSLMEQVAFGPQLLEVGPVVGVVVVLEVDQWRLE